MNEMSFLEIETNNLKKINVSLIKNALNLVIGPSGSGKSSLVYDTIAEVGLHELNSMYSDSMTEPLYKLKSYSGILTTIPIRQINKNNNTHSTIGTFFNYNQYFFVIFSSLLKLPYDYFVLNKKENLCPKCNGIGLVRVPDKNRIIDYNKTIEEIPFKCWIRNKDFFSTILKHYCLDNNIDYSKTFKNITVDEQNSLLSGISTKKYCLKYKNSGHYSQRTTQYFGVLTDIPMLPRNKINDIFYTDIKCPECNGEKYETQHRSYKINGYSIGEVLSLPFVSLVDWLRSIKEKCNEIIFSYNKILSFVTKAVELNIGHLSFNRSIPTLSGGELQRARLVQVFNNQMENLLLVLDEPLVGLSGREKESVYKNIISLIKKHTVLVVDHHSIFFKNAKQIIAIGPQGGKYGGEIINSADYIKSQNQKYKIELSKRYPAIKLSTTNDVYSYKGFTINILKNCCNIIYGASGIGKSTLLREYLPQVLDNYVYISQKPLCGNKHSYVCTSLGVYNQIIDTYAKFFKQETSFFSNLSGAQGCCKSCGGSGFINYGNDFNDKCILKCKDCDGTGFNRKLTGYKINKYNIQDVWKMTLSEAIYFFEKINNNIVKMLLPAKEILLTHLQIGQLTSTLSGGENIRIKLLKTIRDKYDYYGIDEPFRGLNNTEIYSIAIFLQNLSKKNKTIIVVDHENESFKYFNQRIELKNKENFLYGEVVK